MEGRDAGDDKKKRSGLLEDDPLERLRSYRDVDFRY